MENYLEVDLGIYVKTQTRLAASAIEDNILGTPSAFLESKPECLLRNFQVCLLE